MKVYLIIILFLFVTLSYSQDFGKKGTVWQHCYLEEFGPSPLKHDYIEVQSLTDTVVQNLQCHELFLTHEPREFGTAKSIVICNERDRVYYLENDSLHLLYNFSLGKGDRYLLRYPIVFDSSYLHLFPNNPIYFDILIDSISYVTINGQLLKKQHITIGNPGFSHFVMDKYVTEKFGYENWILPNWECFSCERHIFEGLYSYKDSVLSFLNPNLLCGLSAVHSSNRIDNVITLFPNPVHDHIILENTSGVEILNSLIYDLSGKSFPFEKEYSFNQIVMHFNLNPGLYICKNQLANGELLHTKFIIGD